MQSNKTTIKTTALGCMAFLLASCSQSEPVPSPVPEEASDAPVFSGVIAGTRAHDQSWDAGDHIGICGVSGDHDYHDIAYVTPGGDGSFEAVTPGSGIYFHTHDEVEFSAYYPHMPQSHVSGNDAPSVSFDTRRQAAPGSLDFLYARGKGSKSTPEVSFRFDHVMTKVRFTLRSGSGVSYEELKSMVMSLDRVVADGTFDTHTGNVTSGVKTAKWNFSNSANTEFNVAAALDEFNETVSYTLILLPQVFNYPVEIGATIPGRQTMTASLDFTEANRKAGDSKPAHEWRGGRQYNILLTVHKGGMTVENVDISTWEVGGTGSGEAV